MKRQIEMKVLLVNPPLTAFKNSEIIVGSIRFEPLGLLYLAAYLRQAGIEVRILDTYRKPKLSSDRGFAHKSMKARKAQRLPEDKDGYVWTGATGEEIKRDISEFNPDVVGISSMFTVHQWGAHHIAKLTKEVSGDILVIIGGAHASCMPQFVLKDKNVDIVVKGEGEATLFDIVKRLENKEDIFQTDGIVYRKSNNGQIVYNRKRALLDLDNLPFPARDMLDMNQYFMNSYNTVHAMRPPRAAIITSRGCLCNCIFCSIHSVWERTYRTRNPELVVDEMEELMKNFGVREFAFWDDNIAGNKKRIHRLLDEIIRRKLNIRWCTPNGIAIWNLDEEILSKMKKSGCYKLTFGLETGSENTQKFIRKSQIKFDHAKRVIKFANRLGIWTHSAFIVGFPYETVEDIQKTIDFAIESDLDMASFFIAVPYIGTELYDVCIKEGLIKESNLPPDQWLGSVVSSLCSTKNFTGDELNQFIDYANKSFNRVRMTSFLANPWRLIRKIKGASEIRYIFKFLPVGMSRLSRGLGLS